MLKGPHPKETVPFFCFPCHNIRHPLQFPFATGFRKSGIDFPVCWPNCDLFSIWPRCRVPGGVDSPLPHFVERKRTDLIRVTIRSGETPEKLLQRFKRTVAKEGLLKEIKKRSFYEKPSEEKRRKQREFEKLMRKKDRKISIKETRRKHRRR